ncbi:hypothetical protein ACV1BA_004302, partial [Shigella flexneri]
QLTDEVLALRLSENGSNHIA